jgi:hypothetical protein
MAIWKCINTERKKKESISEEITMQKWGKVLHETSGREKGKRKGRNKNEEEADSARRNRNHSRRGRETNEETGKRERHRGAEYRMKHGCTGPKQ